VLEVLFDDLSEDDGDEVLDDVDSDFVAAVPSDDDVDDEAAADSLFEPLRESVR